MFFLQWDLVEENPTTRELSNDDLDQFCHENHYLGWFTTSAKTGLNVKKAMNFMLTKIIENKSRIDQIMPPESNGAHDANMVKLNDSVINKKKGCCNII